MASNVVNRKTIRNALASVFRAGLGSEWDVWNYGTSEFAGKARNVVVASGDTDYPIMSAEDYGEDKEQADAEFDFNIGIFVLYSDDAQSWTAENSQDALDDGRKAITDIVRDNSQTASWSYMRLNGRSRVGIVSDVGGKPYRSEIVPVRISIF